MIPGFAQRRQFKHLSEQEVLALAIASEEDDARIYRWYAQRLRADYRNPPVSSTRWPSRRTGIVLRSSRSTAAASARPSR